MIFSSLSVLTRVASLLVLAKRYTHADAKLGERSTIVRSTIAGPDMEKSGRLGNFC